MGGVCLFWFLSYGLVHINDTVTSSLLLKDLWYSHLAVRCSHRCEQTRPVNTQVVINVLFNLVLFYLKNEQRNCIAHWIHFSLFCLTFKCRILSH